MELIRHLEGIARGLLPARAGVTAPGTREPPASRLPGAMSLLTAASIGRTPGRRRPPTAIAALDAACTTSRDCGRTAVCRASACRCAPGWDRCGTDRCHYLPMSHDHCGRCGATCGPNQLCANGRCA